MDRGNRASAYEARSMWPGRPDAEADSYKLKTGDPLHSHAHHHGPATGRILRWSLAATFAFVAVEVFAGIAAHSLALLSDAGHNFTDGLALLLAWIASYLQSRPADENKTYGYQRAGVLSAFVNALTLRGPVRLDLLRERPPASQPAAGPRRRHDGGGGAWLVLNGGIMWALRGPAVNDCNVRGAFVHMLGDALGSVAIVAGAIAIRFTGWVRVDPALSILIGVLIVWTAWDIIRESLNILLEGLPRGLHLCDVAGSIGAIEGVLGVHDLHIWSLGSNTHALSCHVLIADAPPSASDAVCGA